jgi:hypothetical protein
LKVRRQLQNNHLKFGLLEKALADVSLGQVADMWLAHDLAPLDPQLERLTEELRLAVDLRGRLRRDIQIGTAGEAAIDVLVNKLRPHIHGAHVTEFFADCFQVRSKLRNAPAPFQLVVFLQLVKQLVYTHLLGLRRECLKALALGPQFFHAAIL